MKEGTRGYINADHPVQQRIRKAVSEMTGCDLSRAPTGTDGCGIPVIAVPLRALALGMARLADPASLHDERRFAIARLMEAMKAQPVLVDGTAGMTTAVMSVAGATVRLKPGAEGVFCAALPALGLGVALKIDDGAPRAAEAAMAALLDQLECFDESQRSALAPFLSPRLKTVAGLEAGCLRAAIAR
jgi:L-asparaginase II